MSRLGAEFRIVPSVVKLIAALVYAAQVAFAAFVWLGPRGPQPDAGGAVAVAMFGLMSLLSLVVPVFLLLVGYVYADARRRGMNYVLWTLLAFFIPSAVGVILYFILREPMPSSCPRCGRAVAGTLVFCPGCGAETRRACPQCRQPIEPGWTHCGRCGVALATTPASAGD